MANPMKRQWPMPVWSSRNGSKRLKNWDDQYQNHKVNSYLGPLLGSPGATLALPGSARCHPGSSSSQGWHSRNYLPHFDAGQTIQHITYRLADALPQVALTKMQAQCEKLGLDDPGKQSELRRRIEAYLDAGHGSCILQLPEIAQMTTGAQVPVWPFQEFLLDSPFRSRLEDQTRC